MYPQSNHLTLVTLKNFFNNHKFSLSNNKRRLIYILLLKKDGTLYSIITFTIYFWNSMISEFI